MITLWPELLKLQDSSYNVSDYKEIKVHASNCWSIHRIYIICGYFCTIL